MRKRTVLTKALLPVLVLLTMLLSAFAVPQTAMAGAPPLLGAQPQVVLEALDKNGAPAGGITVTVISVTEGDKVVFQQQTDKSGRVRFTSTLPQAVIETAPGAVKDAVYDVYYVSPAGEMHYTSFAIPHMKDLAGAAAADRQELERSRVKYVKARFKGESARTQKTSSSIMTYTAEPTAETDPIIEEPITDPDLAPKTDPLPTDVNDGSDEVPADDTVPPNDPEPTTTISEPDLITDPDYVSPEDPDYVSSPESLGCVSISSNYWYCVKEEQWYTRATRIGEAHVGSGERVDFNLTSSARVTLEIGLKSGTSNYSANGGVSLSSDTSTSVDYTFNGTCTYVSGYYKCNLGRKIYANYEYRYQKKVYYYMGSYVRTDYEVKPTRLAGSTTYYQWFYSSRDSMSVSSVRGNSYGAWFQIASGASTTKKYSSEEKFSVAASISTPVGTWSPGLTTAYVSSHSIKWSTTSTRTFYHYDWDRYGKNWYSTY